MGVDVLSVFYNTDVWYRNVVLRNVKKGINMVEFLKLKAICYNMIFIQVLDRV